MFSLTDCSRLAGDRHPWREPAFTLPQPSRLHLPGFPSILPPPSIHPSFLLQTRHNHTNVKPGPDPRCRIGSLLLRPLSLSHRRHCFSDGQGATCQFRRRWSPLGQIFKNFQYRLTVEAALAMLRSVRPSVQPNPGFMAQLRSELDLDKSKFVKNNSYLIF